MLSRSKSQILNEIDFVQNYNIYKKKLSGNLTQQRTSSIQPNPNHLNNLV
jgi:hypothetical protein